MKEKRKDIIGLTKFSLVNGAVVTQHKVGYLVTRELGGNKIEYYSIYEGPRRAATHLNKYNIEQITSHDVREGCTYNLYTINPDFTTEDYLKVLRQFVRVFLNDHTRLVTKYQALLDEDNRLLTFVDCALKKGGE